MTRARKVDPAVLRREYVFSSDPDMSITKVAEKYGLARSGVADKARIGRWYEARQEFITSVETKTMEALGDDWATKDRQYRQRLLDVAVRSIEKYAGQLDDKDFRVGSRDAAMWVSIVRLLLEDVRTARQPDANEVADTVTLSPDQYREVYERAKMLLGDGEEEDDSPIPLLRRTAEA